MTSRTELLHHVVEALAEVEGVEPHEFEYSLYDYVETDALRILSTSDHTDWELSFRVPDHSVEVRGDGRILIDGVVVRDLNTESFEA
jgi:hypothetical protein